MCLLPCFPYLSISLACVNFFKLYFFLPLLSSLCLVSDEFPQAIFSLVLLNSMCPVSDNFPRTFSSSLDFDISCEVQCLALLLYLLMCLVIHSQSLLFSCFRCILWAIIFSSFLFYASLSFDDIVDNNISKPYFLDFFCLRCPLGMIISPSCLSFFVAPILSVVHFWILITVPFCGNVTILLLDLPLSVSIFVIGKASCMSQTFSVWTSGIII